MVNLHVPVARAAEMVADRQIAARLLRRESPFGDLSFVDLEVDAQGFLEETEGSRRGCSASASPALLSSR
jgi:hypothetical protein